LRRLAAWRVFCGRDDGADISSSCINMVYVFKVPAQM